MAHIYVRHFGDLFGGQMMKKVVVGSGKMYDFKNRSELIKELTIYKGKTSLTFRKKMSQIAFSETAYYDAVISNYFNTISKTYFPQKIISFGNLIEKLRYGENLIKKVLFILKAKIKN